MKTKLVGIFLFTLTAAAVAHAIGSPGGGRAARSGGWAPGPSVLGLSMLGTHVRGEPPPQARTPRR